MALETFGAIVCFLAVIAPSKGSRSGPLAVYGIPIDPSRFAMQFSSTLETKRKEGDAMLDALAILALLAVTALAVGYAHLCERL